MQRPKNEMLLELCGAGDHQDYADGAQGSSGLYLGCTQRSSEPSTAISGDHVVSVRIEPGLHMQDRCLNSCSISSVPQITVSLGLFCSVWGPYPEGYTQG